MSDALSSDSIARVVQYLRRRVGPGESIFVPRSEPLLYFATDTRNPTPYSGVLPGLREEQEQRILAGLEEVRFVVMSEIDQPLYTYYRDELPAVQAYLERHFALPRSFLGKHNAGWIVVLERGVDRGPAAIDLFDRRDQAHAWIRNGKGKRVSAAEPSPVLGSVHNRRPLSFLLGPRGGGLDFELELPPNAVFQASLGFKRMVGMGAGYNHPRRVRIVVSIGVDGRFERVGGVRAYHGTMLDHGWRPMELDLSRWSGQQVTLRLELVPEGPIDPEAIAWLGSPRIAAKSSAEGGDPAASGAEALR